MLGMTKSEIHDDAADIRSTHISVRFGCLLEDKNRPNLANLQKMVEVKTNLDHFPSLIFR